MTTDEGEGSAEGRRAAVDLGAEIWERAVRGGLEAREEVTARLDVIARRLFRQRRIAPADQDSLVQDAQVGVLRAIEEGLPVRNLDAFLHVRARAALTAWVRERQRIRDRTVDLPLDPVADRFSTPERLETDELERALEDCGGGLGDLYGPVWRLRHHADRRPPQIAAELGLTVEAVHVRLFRASRKVWDCLKLKGVLEGVA